MSDIKEQRYKERAEETRGTLMVITNKMVLPLYFLFWICDIIYVPHLKWEFLAIRALLVPVCFIVYNLANKIQDFQNIQRLSLAYIFCIAFGINLMILMLGDASTPYYAGLNMVAVGCLCFIPWTRRFYLYVVLAIFGPYYLFSGYQIYQGANAQMVVIHTFFIVGTVAIAFFVRYFNEGLRVQELKSRLELDKEIQNRGKIIQEKTEEAMNLSSLSRQFSPQVVNAISKGQVNLTEGVHRANICCLFIDIVNSTQRVTRIDKDNVDKVVSMFMDDTIRTLLKYDITIDKFLGDGILAFCNDPVKYDDYVQRVVNACLEIRVKINERQYLYENYWLNKIQLRYGIASGFANVGFYGSDKFFHSYTAIGPVVNLASRLCSEAEPDEILVSFDVMDKLPIDDYHSSFVGKKNLKGFEDDIIKVYRIDGDKRDRTHSSDSYDCPECTTIMHLDTNEKGIFVYKCRSCGHVLDQDKAATAVWGKVS